MNIMLAIHAIVACVVGSFLIMLGVQMIKKAERNRLLPVWRCLCSTLVGVLLIVCFSVLITDFCQSQDLPFWLGIMLILCSLFAGHALDDAWQR